MTAQSEMPVMRRARIAGGFYLLVHRSRYGFCWPASTLAAGLILPARSRRMAQ